MAGEHEIMRAQVSTTEKRQRLIYRLSGMVRHAASGCVEWQGALNNKGYGKLNFWHEGKHVQVYAHRFFWVLKHCTPIPPGYEPHHTCLNRRCVLHLELLTSEENKALRKKIRHSNGRFAKGNLDYERGAK